MSDNAAILDQRPATSDQRPATSDQNSVLVSIIIPAYNTAKYIHRAIESSIRQTHSNVEIIIIDDGSNDDTLKISQAYAEKDSRIKVIHQENNGVSSARNHGMREANGEYYVFLDSDDWLEDDAVEVLLDAQIKHPDKLIAANFYLVKTDNSKLPLDNENVKSQSLNVKEVAESYAGIHIKDPYPTDLGYIFAKIFRADICSEGLTFPEGIVLCEDRAFIFEYINIIGGMFYISKPVVNYLERYDSAMRAKDSERISKSLHSLIKVYEIMMSHPKNTLEIKKLIGISGFQAMIGFIISSGISKADRKAAVEYLKRYKHDFLTSRRISVKRKLSFIYKFYLPLPVSKAIFYSWKIMKKIRDKIMRK